MPLRNLTCSCGAMGWCVRPDAPGTHVVCYCADCQSFARHLGQTALLDPQGGTDIFQTIPADVTLTRGAGHLACLRLGPKGLRRWYAGCCGTPVGNTLPGPGLPFVGLVLPQGASGFGPATAHVQTRDAQGAVREHGFAATGFALMLRAVKATLMGRTASPFFKDGAPVVEARVLTHDERAAARP